LLEVILCRGYKHSRCAGDRGSSPPPGPREAPLAEATAPVLTQPVKARNCSCFEKVLSQEADRTCHDAAEKKKRQKSIVWNEISVILSTNFGRLSPDTMTDEYSCTFTSNDVWLASI
jgi:hypothetical protein